MKSILITGGLGFVGINLVLRLSKDENNKIIIVDNELYGSRKKIIEKSGIHKNENIKIINMDICKNEFITEMLLYEKIDEIYHLAAIASPIWYKIYAEETLDVSYIGTKNVFIIGKHFDSNILICSSSEVYGDAQISPQNELYFGNTNSYGERSCYDEGKRIMESLAYTYQKKYNMKIHIIRIFNTYGPYMNIEDGRVIPSFIKSYLKHLPIQIFNHGTQTRCFNYIDDTLNGMINLMNSDVYTPVNIGNNREITISYLYEIFKKIMKDKFVEYDMDLKIMYGTSDEDDPKVRKPDLTKAQNLLHYEIKTKLEDGLEKTIQYFIDCQ
jgi:UDP-glucuronate decarboxylase